MWMVVQKVDTYSHYYEAGERFEERILKKTKTLQEAIDYVKSLGPEHQVNCRLFAVETVVEPEIVFSKGQLC